jgi:hypothetical protein
VFWKPRRKSYEEPSWFLLSGEVVVGFLLIRSRSARVIAHCQLLCL